MSERSSNDAAGDAGDLASRILVIDDEEVVHASLRRILSRQGHSVDAELTAAKGLERLAAGGYDLVITDLMMPEMTGIEMLESMKRRGIGLPTIMITGYPTIKTALQSLRLGAVDYLAKPFTRMEILGPVSRALRRERSSPTASVRDTVAPKLGDGLDEPAPPLAPGDRVHLRRHSWAVYRQDGTIDVGIGATFLSVIGSIEAVELPAEADLVEQGYVGFRIKTSAGEEHGVFMPLSGRVVETNCDAKNSPDGIGDGTWLIRIVPDRLVSEIARLVRG